MGFLDSNGISQTIYKQSAPRSRQITTPAPYHCVFTGRVPVWPLISTVCWKWQTFQGYRQSATYTVKVVVCQKWCKMGMLLLHTTNRKCHMAYRFMPFQWPWKTLNVIRRCNSIHAFETLLLNTSVDSDWSKGIRCHLMQLWELGTGTLEVPASVCGQISRGDFGGWSPQKLKLFLATWPC